MKVCGICGEKFDNSRVYSNHIRWKHSKAPYKIHNCKFCGKAVAACSIAKHEVACKSNIKNIRECKCCQKPITGYRTVFCDCTCAALYNNSNKAHGYRRSKLELWIESKLKLLYPDLEIFFNKKFAIGSELDIYIPSMQLAIELNGVYHYKPIHGQKLLDKIILNDIKKLKACENKGIHFHSIDISDQVTFKEHTSYKYLDVVTHLINDNQTCI